MLIGGKVAGLRDTLCVTFREVMQPFLLCYIEDFVIVRFLTLRIDRDASLCLPSSLKAALVHCCGVDAERLVG